MKYKLPVFCFLFLLLLLAGCYGVNPKTSEIGTITSNCLSESDWENIVKEHSVTKIKDADFREGLQYVRNHFLRPKYILYFEEGPKEIIGCDWYTIRVAYNPEIFHGDLDGLSPALSDKEQVRMRNRVLKLLYPYQCPEGKKQLLEEMEKPAAFPNK